MATNASAAIPFEFRAPLIECGRKLAGLHNRRARLLTQLAECEASLKTQDAAWDELAAESSATNAASAKSVIDEVSRYDADLVAQRVSEGHGI